MRRLVVIAALVTCVAGCGSPSAPLARSSSAPPTAVGPTAAATPGILVPTPPPAASTPHVAPPPVPPVPAPPRPAPPPHSASTQVAPGGPPHVMVIVMENREYGSVIGDPTAPYINNLAANYGQATQWYGVSHPSLPNYLALISGSTQGVQDDGTGYTFAGPTLVDQLAAKGIGWRAYMEDMPSPCYAGASAGIGNAVYAKKHDPFMYFTSITTNPGQCARVVPLSRLAGDLAANTAPPFLWVTPNLCDDGHDCGNANADSWLRAEMQSIMNSTWYRQRGSVIITWDEGDSGNGCCGGASGGQIPTIVVTAAGQRRLGTPGDHYGTLRALEEVYGVGRLGAAASGADGDLRPLLAA